MKNNPKKKKVISKKVSKTLDKLARPASLAFASIMVGLLAFLFVTLFLVYLVPQKFSLEPEDPAVIITMLFFGTGLGLSAYLLWKMKKLGGVLTLIFVGIGILVQLIKLNYNAEILLTMLYLATIIFIVILNWKKLK